MKTMVLRSGGYIFLILLGYFLKKKGIFQPKDKAILGNTLMYIFLPAAFVANFANYQGSINLIGFFFLGLIFNMIPIIVSWFVTRKRSGTDKALYMIESSGYNIGAFTTPVVGAMFPPQATVMSSIFDIGNSIFCTGGIYPFASKMTDGKAMENPIKIFFKRLLSSVPFDTYIIMLMISILGIKLPESINSIAAMIGAPAIIVTMIMIGISFEINIKKEELFDIVKIIAIRLAHSFLFAGIIWFLTPFQILEKEVLTICVFAPTTSISPNFCMMCGCNPKVYGAVSSLTVPISLLGFTILMSMFQ